MHGVGINRGASKGGHPNARAEYKAAKARVEAEAKVKIASKAVKAPSKPKKVVKKKVKKS
jgi:hypothetical protein